jgi:hypothetical protein
MRQRPYHEDWGGIRTGDIWRSWHGAFDAPGSNLHVDERTLAERIVELARDVSDARGLAGRSSDYAQPGVKLTV